MTEALTAEERAMVCGGDTDHAAKLLRLYDAALARAEAAEEQAHIEEVLRCGAESRLAEATALLKDIRDVVFDTDFTPSHGKSSRIERLERMLRIPATPAQAAEPEPSARVTDEYPCIIAGVTVHQSADDSELEALRRSVAVYRGVLDKYETKQETTETALRECRAGWDAELRAHAACRQRELSARAERDTALASVPLAQKCDNYRTALPAWNDEITARIKAQGERDTALARIAELTEHNVQQGVRYEFRIARAVAELEASGILTHEDPDPTHVARALEALR